MATPLVVRNSFHMLPLEEKNYRRQQYARARSGGKDKVDDDAEWMLPPLPEDASYGTRSGGGAGGAASEGGGEGGEGGEGVAFADGTDPMLSVRSEEAQALLEEGEEHLRRISSEAGDGAFPSGAGGDEPMSLPPDWLPLSQAPNLGEHGGLPELGGGMTASSGEALHRFPPRPRERSTSYASSDADDHSSLGPSLGGETRESIGNEPLWLSMSMQGAGASTLSTDTQLQAMAQQQQQQQQAAAAAAAAQGSMGGTAPAIAAAMPFPTAAATPLPTATATAVGASAALPVRRGSCGFAFAPCEMSTSSHLSSSMPSPFPLSQQHSSESLGGFSQLGVESRPRLFDCSCREGPCAGGAATEATVVSDTLIKCHSPPFSPILPQPRHEIAISIVCPSGAPASGAIPYAYLRDVTPTSGIDGAGGSGSAHQTPRELLRRLLASLERAQAAASATGSVGGSPAAIGDVGLSAFNVMDEHGYSLAEYSVELKAALGVQDGAAATGSSDASDLQQQHQEMANMLKRERLHEALAKRPAIETLQQQNILPDAQQAFLARQKLATAMERRPTAETLQQQNILPSMDAGQQALLARQKLATAMERRPTAETLQQQNILRDGHEEVAQEELLAKRKRLEGFLAERPTLEQVQAALPAVASNAVEMSLDDASLEQLLGDADP
jgi:hypothetical protein